jgi:hypothetical protein
MSCGTPPIGILEGIFPTELPLPYSEALSLSRLEYCGPSTPLYYPTIEVLSYRFDLLNERAKPYGPAVN